MKRADLNLGEFYAVRIVHPGHGPVCPRVEVRKRLELLDVRLDGVCILAEDRFGYDLPVGRRRTEGRQADRPPQGQGDGRPRDVVGVGGRREDPDSFRWPRPRAAGGRAVRARGGVMTDVRTDDHGPGIEDSSGHVRCEGCGYRWPCPSARSGPRPLEAGEWDVLRSLDVTVGFSLWRRMPLEAEDLEPYGGMVVGSWTDESGATVYRLLDFPRGRHRYRTLRLAEVEPATVGLPNSAFMRSYARKLAATVGKQKGAATGEELELLADAVELLRAI